MATQVFPRRLKNAVAGVSKRFVPLAASLLILSAILLDKHPVGWIFAGLLVVLCLLKSADVLELI